MMVHRRATGHFAARIMRLQFAVLAVLGVLITATILYTSYENVFTKAQESSLTIARTIASDPEVRSAVAAEAQKETLDRPALRDGYLQHLATETAAVNGAAFVVITEDRGLRLTHPHPAQIGQRVSTEPVALRGVEEVTRAHGTLGESVRAKVPVYAPEGPERVVGEVSVGVRVQSLSDELWRSVLWVAAFALAAVLLSAWAGLATVRRLKQQTLGLEPGEIVQLVRDQQAVLYGVTEGMIGLGADGVITVRNRAARQMLGLPHRTDKADVVGRHYASAALPERLVQALREGTRTPIRLEVGANSLVATINPVVRDGVDLGRVVLLTDVTTVEALGTKLDAVQDMADALRAQRHEFANRMHAILGLLNLGQQEQARDYLREVLASGPLVSPVPGLQRVADPFLSAFISAKAITAQELGIDLRISEDSQLFAQIASARDAQDVTAVLGNMLDNAYTAALANDAECWVEIDLLSEGDTLHLAVADSGPGIAPGLEVFDPQVSTGSHVGPGHGQGVGLPLIRRLARARGGDVWIADSGGGGEGAVVAARLPAVLTDDNH
ncbi:sensor histidine kinase [Glutamicibacter endophyticus]